MENHFGHTMANGHGACLRRIWQPGSQVPKWQPTYAIGHSPASVFAGSACSPQTGGYFFSRAELLGARSKKC
jgi:hypothetical protein